MKIVSINVNHNNEVMSIDYGTKRVFYNYFKLEEINNIIGSFYNPLYRKPDQIAFDIFYALDRYAA